MDKNLEHGVDGLLMVIENIPVTTGKIKKMVNGLSGKIMEMKKLMVYTKIICLGKVNLEIIFTVMELLHRNILNTMKMDKKRLKVVI